MKYVLTWLNHREFGLCIKGIQSYSSVSFRICFAVVDLSHPLAGVINSSVSSFKSFISMFVSVHLNDWLTN